MLRKQISAAASLLLFLKGMVYKMTIEEMLAHSDYKNVLKYFTEISSVPRGSGHNEKISEYIVNFAKEHNLRYVQDEALNVIIYKDAAKGYELHTPVILQGHMDMVCVTEEGFSHDFENEGLELLVEDDYITANKTTLGADDGIAIAYAMAILADDRLLHPALEVVITTDEETGMDGAKALDTSLLKGRMMINLDSEDEDCILCSCAGGMRCGINIPLARVTAEGEVMDITISGLKGGHSGAEINKNRANATLLAARLLMELSESIDYLCISLKGGEKDNAIPAYAKLSILIKDEAGAKAAIEALTQKYKKELSTSEPDLDIRYEVRNEETVSAIHPNSFSKMLFVLIQAPDGVQEMSADIEGLVESSLNLGVFETCDDVAEFNYALRSSVSSYKYFMRDKLAFLAEFAGGECESGSEYPAWEYKKDSALREEFGEVYRMFYGKKARFEAIHAGLECGIICEKVPDMDIVSIGPLMHDIHSPAERLSITSALRLYRFLETLLSAMR